MQRSFNTLLFMVCLVFSASAQELLSFPYEHGRLFYHQYGKGEYVILLSGGPGNDYSQLHAVAVQLANHYTVVLPEQRGTGRSIPAKVDSTTITVTALTEDLKKLVDHLKLKQVKIIGHSWGAMLAMNFAGTYPDKVKSLYLVSPGPYREWNQNFKTLQANILSRLGSSESETLLALSEKIKKGIASKSDSLQRRKIARSAYIFDKNKLDTLFPTIDVKQYPQMQQLLIKDIGKNYDVSQTLTRFKGPVHILCGRQDVLAFCTYELKIFRPNSTVHWIENSGHFPMYEQPQPFYAQLTSLLK